MYCQHCGKELNEGEVCDCTPTIENSPRPKFSDTVMSTLYFAKDLFLEPCETIKSYFTLNYGKMNVKLMLLKAIWAFMVVLVLGKSFCNNTVLDYLHASSFELALMVATAMIIVDLIYAGAIYLSSGVCGTRLGYRACRQIVTVATPWQMIIFTLAIITGCLCYEAGVVVWLLIVIPTAVLSAIAIMGINGTHPNTKIAIIIVSTILVSLVVATFTLMLLINLSRIAVLYSQYSYGYDNGYYNQMPYKLP